MGWAFISNIRQKNPTVITIYTLQQKSLKPTDSL